jgi:hypothetical protein
LVVFTRGPDVSQLSPCPETPKDHFVIVTSRNHSIFFLFQNHNPNLITVTNEPFDLLVNQIDPNQQTVSSAAVKKIFLFIQLNAKHIGNLLDQNLIQKVLFFSLLFKTDPLQNSFEFLALDLEISSYENLSVFLVKTHRIQTGKSIHLN